MSVHPTPPPTIVRPIAVRHRVSVNALLAAVPLLLMGLLVWPGRGYALDLFSHFVPQFAGVAGVIGAVLMLRAWFRPAGVSWLAAGVAMFAWHAWWTTPPASGDGGRSLRVIQYNAHAEWSAQDDGLKALLRSENADLVCLIETPWGYAASNPWLREMYPYRVEPDIGLEWPNLLLSRYPLELTPIEGDDPANMFSFVARRSVTVTLDDGIRFLWTAMHPPSPRTASSWRRALHESERDAALLNRYLQRGGLPVLVTGDFNSAPTGRLHQRFAAVSGLTGWTPVLGAGTWPAAIPRWFSAPIDRLWTSPPLRITRLDVGPRLASDHRPVLATLVIPSPAAVSGTTTEMPNTPTR